MKTSSRIACSLTLLILSACGGGSGVDTAATPAVRMAGQAREAAPVASDYYDLLQRIYMGYFGRPVDVDGLGYWAEVFRAQGMPVSITDVANAYAGNASVRALVDVFGSSQESKDLYPGDNNTFINAIYRNLFNRDADAAGKAYWANLVDTGAMTRPIAALSIMSGALGSDLTLINKKSLVATRFTATLQKNMGSWQTYASGAYSGMTANQYVRTLMASVTVDTDVDAFQVQIDAAIAALIAAVSGGPSLPVTLGYAGYNYLQDLNASAGYAAQYTGSVSQVGLLSGTLTFGKAPLTVSFNVLANSGIAYGAPITYGVLIASNAANRALPAVAMLCRTVAGKGSSRGKSTDVLVANSATPVISAAVLANQTLTQYREDCVQGGTEPEITSGLSFAFDASGGATATGPDGVARYTAAAINQALNGQPLYDAASGKYTLFHAYSYLRIDGSTGYAIVARFAPAVTGLSNGVLAVWSQAY